MNQIKSLICETDLACSPVMAGVDGAGVVGDDALLQLDVPHAPDRLGLLHFVVGPVGALVQLEVEQLHDAGHVHPVGNLKK